MYGRRVITTDVEDITSKNVVGVLQTAMTTHIQNQTEIQCLYDYYKGKQPILNRVKVVREEINNKVIENAAYEIVEFKTGYFTYEPVQYVSASDSDEVTQDIETLNKYMMAIGKSGMDVELAMWFHVCGTAYRMVLPNKNKKKDDGDVPFELYVLDPRNTFVVRHNGLGNKPVMACKYVARTDGTVVYNCYTEDKFFKISDQISIILEKPNPLGIPIIEYPANFARLGAFEVVMSLIDAINEIESNRVDAIQQFVQAILLFHNVKIDEDSYKSLKEKGAISYKDVDPQLRADIQYLCEELNQDQTQTVVDHLYTRILTVCGMPNRNGGGGSTSDTGKAVIYRDGWGAAEYRAKLTESCFRSSENAFLRLIMKICRDTDDINLKPTDFEIRMPRRNYDNVKEKADTLCMMLDSNKIEPKLAFEHCGLFIDPETAYQMSKTYAEEQEKKIIAELNKTAGIGGSYSSGAAVVVGGGGGDSGYKTTHKKKSSKKQQKKGNGVRDGDGDGIVNEE